MNWVKKLFRKRDTALSKPVVSSSSFAGIVYGVGIFIMLVIMVFGALVLALGY